MRRRVPKAADALRREAQLPWRHLHERRVVGPGRQGWPVLRIVRGNIDQRAVAASRQLGDRQLGAAPAEAEGLKGLVSALPTINGAASILSCACPGKRPAARTMLKSRDYLSICGPGRMRPYLEPQLLRDLASKTVVLTGARRVGKTTLARQLMERFDRAQYLNWDVPVDRAVLLRQSWNPAARLLVLDEIHKMPHWKSWLKGVIDAKLPAQSLLVTGSARMDTFRQSGESLAGRYLHLHLAPISVREWCVHRHTAPLDALLHLIDRGGFPEPCLAKGEDDAQRWRRQYATDLIREDVLEFSRLHEINTMRVFFELLRERVG